MNLASSLQNRSSGRSQLKNTLALAKLVLDPPASFQANHNFVSGRDDLKTFGIGCHVHVTASVNKYHRMKVTPIGKGAATMFSAQVFLGDGTRLPVVCFGKSDYLVDAFQNAFAGNRKIYLEGILDDYNGVYQLKEMRLSFPSSKTSAEYHPQKKMSSLEVKSLVANAINNSDVITQAKQILLKHLGLNDERSFQIYTKVYGYPFKDIETLIRTAHSDNGRQASQQIMCMGIDSLLKKRTGDWNEKSVPVTPIDLERARSAVSALLKSFPFQPTDEQLSIVDEVLQLYSKGERSRSLVYGDVGFGKTAVFGLVVGALAEQGRSTVVLSPLDTLARQTCDNLSKWFSGIPNIEVSLVNQSTDTIPVYRPGCVYVGTSAILSRAGDEYRPDFVVVDEEQRFGSLQREMFEQRGAHYLAATATPIPRTVALTQLQSYKVFRLTKCFVEKHITSQLLLNKEKMLRSMMETINEGRQVLFICPKTEDDDPSSKLVNVEKIKANLATFFGDENVVMVHGKRKSKDNVLAMNAMRTGQAKILVATTAVEVGVDLPGLKHLVIFNPERFGLQQLHQLRGRISRQGGDGSVHLYSPYPLKPEQFERLRYFCSTMDGEKIAEFDVKRRGMGDLRPGSEEQSGQFEKTFVRNQLVNYEDLQKGIKRQLQAERRLQEMSSRSQSVSHCARR